MAERLAQQIPGGFYVNQFANDANSEAHLKTTGPEIWEQMGHDIDAYRRRHRLGRDHHGRGPVS